MIVLPLIYFALAGAVGYGLYWHATTNVAWFTQVPAHAGEFKVKLIGYVVPLVTGGIVIFFMIKPILARPVARDPPLTLDESQEPRLFAFVRALCETVGAPVPRRIDIDFTVNASAGFRRGFLSFLGSDLVLTLGLPMAAGLTLGQLAGVMAHEFGHFSQGVARRLHYLVNSISRWLARVAYERDFWDFWLQESASNPESRSLSRLFCYLCMLVIWLTRCILKMLVGLGCLVGAFMLRRMEYNADRFEAAVVGVEVFESTAKQLARLNIAFDTALDDLGKAWSERRLADNLPSMVALKARSLPDEEFHSVYEKMFSQRRGFMSTHPSDAARVAHVRRYASEPVFRSSEPATSLFANFKMIAHAVTLTFYRDVAGLKVEKENLVPTQDLVDEGQKAAKAGEATLAYLSPGVIAYHALFLQTEAIEAPGDARQTASRLKAARIKLMENQEKIKKAMDMVTRALDQRHDCEMATILSEAKISFDPASYRVRTGTAQAITDARQQAESQLTAAGRVLDSANGLRRVRLLSALQLLHVQAIQSRVSSARAYLDETSPLLAALARIESSHAAWKRLMTDVSLLVKVLQMANSETELEKQFPKLMPVARSLATQTRVSLDDLRSAFTYVRYPFTHAGGSVKVAQVIFDVGDERPATKASLVSTARLGMYVHGSMLRFLLRIMNRLAAMATEVEEVLKLGNKVAARTAITPPAS